MLDKCFPLSKTPYPTVLNRQYHAGWNTNHWMEYQPKSNEKYVPFLHCISSFEGTFYNKMVQPPDLLFVVVLH